MRIAEIDTRLVSIPFTTGPASGWSHWNRLDSVLVRVETDDGLVGWGEAFGYMAARPTRAALDHMIAPGLIGADVSDIAAINRAQQQAHHLGGRYGVTIFALSGLDIALWDIAAKAAGLPLCRLLGGSTERTFAAYASLFRYGDPDAVAESTGAAVDEGYRYVKLHETGVAETRAARRTGGDDLALMVDTNCPWTPAQAAAMAARLQPFDLYWLEEPIFPPEDYAALAELRRTSGVALAAGENACTAVEFARMFAAGAVTYAQPSVTKVGGITEFRKVAALAEAANVAVVPHAPYFGPGFLATLHLLAAMPGESLVERLYVTPEAKYYDTVVDPVAGFYSVPDGPGLGLDPDPNVIRDYEVTGDGA